MSTASLLIIVILVILFVGGAPVWPHSESWGYVPSGVMGLILLIFLILLLTGRL